MEELEMNFVLAKSGSRFEVVPAGTTIFSEGDTGDCMYYLHRGCVDIIIDGKCVSQLGAGNIFGELSLIDGSARSATVRTSDDSEISRIDSETFLNLVSESPHVSLDIMKMIAGRLRRLNQLL